MRVIAGALGFVGVAMVACASAPPPVSARRADAGGAPAVTFEGAWEGALVSSLHLVLEVQRAGAGWTATLDSPDQHANHIPVGAVSLKGDALELELPRISATYVARIDAQRLGGTWSQGGRARPLTFTKRKGTAGDAPGLDGTWDGVLQIRLGVVVKIARAADGWTATVDIPEQHVRDLHVSVVSVDGDRLRLASPHADASYEGRLVRDKLVGTFTQRGRALALELERTTRPSVVPPRPQEPKRPLPYDEIALAVANQAAGLTLGCTLTTPRGAGPFPAVVLATGSGPQDRDESIGGHKPFLVLSDALTRQGIEVLRCDDRGVGASTGTFATATTFDTAGDVLAGVAALRARPEVARVGVIGHSEGATVAAVAATRSSDVAFIVLLAGPALPGDQILDLQRAWFEKANGKNAQEISDSKAKWDEAFGIIKTEADDGAARKKLRALYEGLPAAAQRQIEGAGGFEAQARELLSPWSRTFLALDPRAYLAQVRVPVLALDGELDMQVPPAANLPEMRQALGRDPDVTIRALPGLNHLFQTARTGAPREYAEIDETMSPVALALVTEWISGHAR